MSGTKVDLWPEDIGATDLKLKPPVVILREQAALLAEKTRGVLDAQIRTDSQGSDIYHTFTIVAPALGHYTYDLFTLRQGPTLYPLRQAPGPYASPPSNRAEIGSEEDLLEFLRERFSSDETKKIIYSLIAQSQT